MGRALFAIVLAAAAACGDDNSGKGGGGVSNTSGGSTVRAVATTTDVWRDGFLRAANGAAVLKIPRVGADWTVSHARPAGGTTVKLEYNKGASVTVAIAVEKTGDVDPKVIAEGSAQQVIAQRPGSIVRGGGAFDHPSGNSAHRVTLESSTPNGVKLAIGVIVVAEGPTAVTVFTVAPPAMYESGELPTVLQAIHANLKVGSKVPKIDVPAPKKSLEGVFIWTGNKLGQYEAYVFDRRGVMHQYLATTLDMDSYYQSNPTYIARYEFDGAKLTVIWPGKDPYSYPTTLDGDVLKVDGYSFFRSDGKLSAGTKFDGYWDATTYSSSMGAYTSSQSFIQRGYTFTKAGGVSTSSFVGTSSWDTPGSPNPVGQGTAYREAKPSGGSYKLVGDLLQVTYPDGRAGYVTLYPYMNTGKPDLDILYIDGRSYLRD